MREQQSSAVKLLQHVWDHMQEATSHSWLKVNHAMADALRLAIRSGMRFDLNDFEYIAKEFRSGYWTGNGEWIYSLAVIYRNSSAYLAFEHKRNRTPIIIKGASIYVHTGDGPCGNGLSRLIVGAEFTWAGDKVKVGSFNDAKGYVNVRSHDGKRAMISRDSIIQARSIKKEKTVEQPTA